MQWLWVVKLSLFMHFVKLCLIIEIVLVGRGRLPTVRVAVVLQSPTRAVLVQICC